MLARTSDHFLERYRNQGLKLTPVIFDKEKPMLCQLCGYAIVEFDIAPGWIMQSCSAFSLPRILKHRYLESWAQHLAKTGSGTPEHAQAAIETSTSIARRSRL